MFGALCDLLINSIENYLIPILGGDLNCRYGDLNTLLEDETHHFSMNVDGSRNNHGNTYGRDLCKTAKIFPLNHLNSPGNSFDGDFTYFKGNTNSQIDYVYTNQAGLSIVKSLSIYKENWHLHDHLHIGVTVHVCEEINATNLLKRSKDLNYTFNPKQVVIKRHLGVYNFERFEKFLLEIPTRRLIMYTQIRLD